MPLNTGSSSSSSGDDNNAEPSSDLETDSYLKLIESLAATAVPLPKAGHQKVAAKSSCSLFKFMKPLNNCTDTEIKQMKTKKHAEGVKFAAEIASRKTCMIASCVT